MILPFTTFTSFTSTRCWPVLMPISFGEAPERRPWAIKREDRPAAFAGRSYAVPLG